MPKKGSKSPGRKSGNLEHLPMSNWNTERRCQAPQKCVQLIRNLRARWHWPGGQDPSLRKMLDALGSNLARAACGRDIWPSTALEGSKFCQVPMSGTRQDTWMRGRKPELNLTKVQMWFSSMSQLVRLQPWEVFQKSQLNA